VIAASAFAWGTRAHAYCRAVTASPPSGYDPAVSGCFLGANNDLPPLFWRNQCVGYNLQRDASQQVTIGQASAVAASAFATWNFAPCPGGGAPSITATALAPVSCDSVPSQEHNNPIIFRDDVWPYADRANSIGYTTLTVDLVSGEILGAAIEINTANHTIVADGGPLPAGAYDLASILTHEAGHFLGLAHSASTNAVMYAFYQPGSTTLGTDDVAGICTVYAPDGSRSTQLGAVAGTACDPTPIEGLTDDCGSLDAALPGSPASSSGASLTIDAGDPAPCQYNVLSCGVAAEGDPDGGARFWPGAVAVALVAAARLRRRRASRSTKVAPSSVALVGVALALACAGDARASVSIAATLDELARESSAVAVVTPVEQDGLWEDGRIVTYTKVRAERVVAGRAPAELWVRTMGGAVGRVGQVVEGEAAFEPGRSSLVFLRAHSDAAGSAASSVFGVAEGAQGQFPMAIDAGHRAHLAANANPGQLIAPSAGSLGPFARDVLAGLSIDAAAREIASAWRRARRPSL
jgi:MYXO-CTERM domain-containing protein